MSPVSVVQWRHDSHLLLLFLALRLLFRIKAWRAGLRPSATKKLKSLRKNWLENENTKKKTLYDKKVFKEYLDACDEKREIEDITPVSGTARNHQKICSCGAKEKWWRIRTLVLRAFIQSIDQHLRKNNYGLSVLNDKEFHEVQDILKKKQKQLKSIGKGNRPNAADPLSDEDIDTFYSRKVLGIQSPRALLNTLWMNNCTFICMSPGKEQGDLCWGDF